MTSSIAGDIVLSQQQYSYDADGNVIATVNQDRLAGDSESATGALGDATGLSSPSDVTVTVSQTLSSIQFSFGSPAITGGTTDQFSATTSPATAYSLGIATLVDPNNAGILNKDISGKNVEWVVGQNVDLQAQVAAPVGLPAPTYLWSVGAHADKDYQQKTSKAQPTQLAKADTVQQNISYYYIAGGNETVTLTVAIGGKIFKTSTTFAVDVPTVVSFTGTETTDTSPVHIGNIVHPTNEWSFGGGMQNPTSAGITFNGVA